MTSCVQRSDVYSKETSTVGQKRKAKDAVFNYFWQSLTWDVRQELLPALFIIPGGELIKRRAWRPGKNCKEVLASSQFRVLINSHEK